MIKWGKPRQGGTDALAAHDRASWRRRLGEHHNMEVHARCFFWDDKQSDAEIFF